MFDDMETGHAMGVFVSGAFCCLLGLVLLFAATILLLLLWKLSVLILTIGGVGVGMLIGGAILIRRVVV